MGRKLRHFESDGIYFVTNRCAKGRYLLTPGPRLNHAVESLLARYTTCTDVELFAWMFMGNHFHLIARSHNKRIPDFMRDFQSALSDRVQDLREGWDESVFPERYSAEPILDDEAVREKILYVWMNPVRAGLVRHPDDWPGVSSVGLHQDGAPREVEYLDRTRLGELRRRADDPEAVDPERATSNYELEVTNPPALEDRTVAEAGADLRESLDGLCRHWADMSRVGGEEFAGADQVRAQDPLERPDEPPEAPEPLCLTSCPDKREAYRRRYQNVVSSYRRAMEKWRAGELEELEFPSGTYPPGWMKAAGAGDFPGPDGDSDESDGGGGDDGGSPDDGEQSGPDGPRGDPDATDRAA